VGNKKSTPWSRMMSMNPALAQEGDVDEMSQTLGGMSVIPTQAPPNVPTDVRYERMNNQVNETMDQAQGDSKSASTTESYLGPEADPYLQRIKELSQQTEDYRLKSLAEQQGGVDQYQKDISSYENAGRDIDWRPLAAMLDTWGNGSNLYKAASDIAPESVDAKRKNLMAMKQQLQAMKGSMSKEQYGALKDQLDANLVIIKEMGAEKRLMASINAKGDTQGRLKENDNEKRVEAISKRLGGANSVLITQKINRLNETIPGGLWGEGEIPNIGVGQRWVPGFLRTDAGAGIRQDAEALLTESMKAATGLSATEMEAKIQQQINGLSQSSTANQFRQGLRKQLEDNLAKAAEIFRTYPTEAKETYRARQGGETVVDILDKINKGKKIKKKAGGGTPTEDDIDKMTPEQLREYLGK
jgi:hypothetical protein